MVIDLNQNALPQYRQDVLSILYTWEFNLPSGYRLVLRIDFQRLNIKNPNHIISVMRLQAVHVTGHLEADVLHPFYT